MGLPQGETVIGRGLSCRLRFNDSSVSRAHARIRVEGEVATIEDAGSRNGTEVNEEPLTGIRTLQHGDVVQLGRREIQVQLADPGEFFETSTAVYSELPHSGASAPTVPSDSRQRCPACKNRVSVVDDLCSNCGYSWASFRPGSVTKDMEKIPRESVERRRHARHRLRVPTVYTSENLTVESTALDLSRSGVFVQTQILDEVGTPCELTIMADGAPAFTFQGKVKRVVEREERGQSLGLGIEFVGLTPQARRWLDDTIIRLGTS